MKKKKKNGWKKKKKKREKIRKLDIRQRTSFKTKNEKLLKVCDSSQRVQNLQLFYERQNPDTLRIFNQQYI